jgi:hypothetical protein
MREIGMDAIALDDRYPKDAKDTVWLAEAGAKSWIIVTKDHEIQHNFPEIDAIMVHRVGCFLLPRKLNGDEQVALVLKVHKRMENIALSRSTPFIYTIYRDSRMDRRDTEEWLKAWREQRSRKGLPPIVR